VPTAAVISAASKNTALSQGAKPAGVVPVVGVAAYALKRFLGGAMDVWAGTADSSTGFTATGSLSTSGSRRRL
jgi:hypothetical protein